MIPAAIRAMLRTAALAAVLAACSVIPAATDAPAGQAEREALVGQFMDAVGRGDAAAIEAMTDPAVDARADIAAILEAHGSRPWGDIRVAWGADDFGGQAIWADITGTTPQGPDAIRVLTIWDGRRATLALEAAPGVDPGSDPRSPRPVPSVPGPSGGSAMASAPPGQGEPTPVGSPVEGDGPILLITPMAGGAAMEANVAGVLGISARGCVTVGDLVLVAPPGSSVTPDGIRLPGVGDVAFGARLAVSGGVVEIARMPVGPRPAGYERCDAVELAVVSAP